MNRTLSTLLLAAVVGGAGCATRQPKAESVTQFQSRNTLTRDQLAASNAVNAYDAVMRLRGHWMRLRGTSQMPAQQVRTPTGTITMEQSRENPVWAYLDDQKLGTVDQLRNIEIAVVQYVQFLSPAEASSRYGMGHTGGVIYVSTRPLP